MNAVGIILIILILILLGVGAYFIYENYLKDELFPPPPVPDLVEEESLPPLPPLPKPLPPTDKKEVYNIGNNLFKYDDAEHLCKAFGGELATYEQVEKAFEKGADWCNYGWSQDQMALYPTQKSTWENLQKRSQTS